jgi:hypothetical protein
MVCLVLLQSLKFGMIIIEQAEGLDVGDSLQQISPHVLLHSPTNGLMAQP